MEVKIGVQDAARELSIESSQSREEVLEAFRAAVAADGGIFELADERGRTIAVPTTKIAYVDLGIDNSRKVGFGS